MSMNDPISDMLTIIRNGQIAKKKKVYIPYSVFKKEIIKILYKEGFIKKYTIKKNIKTFLKVKLKYFKGKSVIENIKRISKPSLRVYKKYKKLPKVIYGIGIAILSTSKGIMSDKTARKLMIGGEIICHVS
ncbi:MAG: 30S ribosomal protein S8 [Candidatus Makana argininalis]